MVLDLNFDIQIVGCPIVREEDGLAKSSRNTYLSCEERKAALCLSKAVKKGQELIRNGIAASEVLEPMCEIINSEPLARIDYVSMVDALSMQPVDSVNADVLVAMAVTSERHDSSTISVTRYKIWSMLQMHYHGSALFLPNISE